MASWLYCRNKLEKFGAVAIVNPNIPDWETALCRITTDCCVEVINRSSIGYGCAIRTYYDPPVFHPLDGSRVNVAGVYKSHGTLDKAIQYALNTTHPGVEYVSLCGNNVRLLVNITHEGRRFTPTARVHAFVGYRDFDRTPFKRKSIYWNSTDPTEVGFIEGVCDWAKDPDHVGPRFPENVLGDWLIDTVPDFMELWEFGKTVNWNGTFKKEEVADGEDAAEDVPAVPAG